MSLFIFHLWLSSSIFFVCECRHYRLHEYSHGLARALMYGDDRRGDAISNMKSFVFGRFGHLPTFSMYFIQFNRYELCAIDCVTLINATEYTGVWCCFLSNTKNISIIIIKMLITNALKLLKIVIWSIEKKSMKKFNTINMLASVWFHCKMLRILGCFWHIYLEKNCKFMQKFISSQMKFAIF